MTYCIAQKKAPRIKKTSRKTASGRIGSFSSLIRERKEERREEEERSEERKSNLPERDLLSIRSRKPLYLCRDVHDDFVAVDNVDPIGVSFQIADLDHGIVMEFRPEEGHRIARFRRREAVLWT